VPVAYHRLAKEALPEGKKPKTDCECLQQLSKNSRGGIQVRSKGESISVQWGV